MNNEELILVKVVACSGLCAQAIADKLGMNADEVLCALHRFEDEGRIESTLQPETGELSWHAVGSRPLPTDVARAEFPWEV